MMITHTHKCLTALSLIACYFPGVALANQSAFNGSNAKIPGKIEAENYDLGGQGMAYNDTNSNNIGGAYRNDGVDIGTKSGASNGHAIGWGASGEWVEFTTDVTAGDYSVVFSYSSGADSRGDL